METSLVKKKQIDNTLFKLTGLSRSNIFYSEDVTDNFSALRSINQHSYYLCECANFKLLKWIFEKSDIADLNYILNQIEPNIFTDKLKYVLNLKTFGKTDDELFIYHSDCIKYMLRSKKSFVTPPIVDKIIEFSDICFTEYIVKNNFTITTFSVSAALRSDDIDKLKIVCMNSKFKVGLNEEKKILKFSKSSKALIFIYTHYHFSIEPLCAHIVEKNMVDFINYLHADRKLQVEIIWKLLKIGGIKWVDNLEKLIGINLLIKFAIGDKHMISTLRYIVKKWNIWDHPLINDMLEYVSSKNTLICLVNNLPRGNIRSKDSLILLISEYIEDDQLKRKYINKVLNR